MPRTLVVNAESKAEIIISASITAMAVDTELYDLLGVPPNADEAEIKKAYRRKAREHHPDKNRNDPDAAQKFQEMAAAYEILLDPDARAEYDLYGMQGLANAGKMGGANMDTSDLFSELFGSSGFQFAFNFDDTNGRSRAKSSTIPYEVTLEDLYNGKNVKLNLEKETLCMTCKGTGAKSNTKPKQCIKCEGKGWTIVTSPELGSRRIGAFRNTCSDCDGSGEVIREKDRCKKCKGKKVVAEKKRHEIDVEKGMSDKQKIILAGEGDQVPGMPPGDVVFILKMQRHTSFERSGNDLLIHVNITLSEALFGFSRVLITHLDGRGLKVTSPVGKIIKPHDTIILRGEGMPVYKQKDQKGDLYVVFNVDFPTDDWLKNLRSSDRKALESSLPPKRQQLSCPGVVQEVPYEECDVAGVRARSFEPGSDFFTEGFDSQFGEAEDEWTDDDSEFMPDSECTHQ